MYWYRQSYNKISFFLSFAVGIGLISSCKPSINSSGQRLKYFDLKGYFLADSARLTKLDPLITKTVTHNSYTETKKVHIKDWGAELSLFTESDINKPAWRADYNIQQSGDFLIYKAKKNTDLKTRDIIIKKEGDKIKWILIFNHTKNILYESEEKLSYFPDSLYIIRKLQRVRFLGLQKYTIKGVFN